MELGIVNSPRTPEMICDATMFGLLFFRCRAPEDRPFRHTRRPAVRRADGRHERKRESLDVERAEALEKQHALPLAGDQCLDRAASVAPVYGFRPAAARMVLMMFTALAPPCASARINWASAYRVIGSGMASPAVSVAALYFAGM